MGGDQTDKADDAAAGHCRGRCQRRKQNYQKAHLLDGDAQPLGRFFAKGQYIKGTGEQGQPNQTNADIGQGGP